MVAGRNNGLSLKIKARGLSLKPEDSKYAVLVKNLRRGLSSLSQRKKGIISG